MSAHGNAEHLTIALAVEHEEAILHDDANELEHNGDATHSEIAKTSMASEEPRDGCQNSFHRHHCVQACDIRREKPAFALISRSHCQIMDEGVGTDQNRRLKAEKRL